MKKLIFILLFTFLYADNKYLIYKNYLITYSSVATRYNYLSATCNYIPGSVIINHYFYTILNKKTINNLNLTCYHHYASKLCGSFYSYNPSIIDYCTNKSSYTFSTVTYQWVNTKTGSVLCSPNTFNENGQCKSVCGQGNIYFGYNGQYYCISPDVNLLSKVLDTNLTGCKFKSTYFTVNGKAYIGLQCGSYGKLFPYANTDISLSQNKDVNVSTPKTITCSADETLVITSDGNAYCQKVQPKDTNKTVNLNKTLTKDEKEANLSSSSLKVTSTGSDTNNSSNTNSNASNSINLNKAFSKDENESKCPSPCSIKDNVGEEEVLQGTCHIITYPVIKGCNLSYQIKNGVCVPGCGSATSESNSSSNVQLSKISSKLNTTNSELKNINKTLTDIKNMKPDSNFSPAKPRLNSLELGLISNLKTFYGNTKNSLQTLRQSYDEVLNLVKHPKKFTLFQTVPTYSCPIYTTLYGHTVSLDACKFVYPYKPVLQLFFTLLFSLSVIFYFFDVILRRNK